MTTASTSSLPLLDLKGTWREIGRAHAEAARDRIVHNLDLYFRRFCLEGGVNRTEARRRGALYLNVINKNAPDYAEMMRGLAEASGHDLIDIATLNARYEILYSEFSRTFMEASGRPDGCTAFAALPDSAPDGHLRIGQNWDWIPDVQGLLLRIRLPDGLRVLCFTEAGIAGGKIGLNSAGLGLAINGLMSRQDDWSRLRTPFHVRTWQILTSRTVEAALEAVLSEERSCSANFLIGHDGQDGGAKVVDIETSPTAAAIIDLRSGVLAHANHFLTAAAHGNPQPFDAYSSTLQRCDRMERLLDQHHDNLDDARLTALLGDHDGYPRSLCSHPTPGWPEEEQFQTVFSTVINLTTREFLAAFGNPCQAPFKRYAFI